MKNIIFFFPYRGVAGVSVQFLEIANSIKNIYKQYNVFMVDYKDGYMAQNKGELDLIPTIEGKKTIIPVDSLLVMQAMPPFSMFSKNLVIPHKTKLFFWGLHQGNLSVLGSRDICYNNWQIFKKCFFHVIFIFKKKKLRTLLKLAIRSRSIVFMDDEVRAINCNNLNISPCGKLLPVPINLNDIHRRRDHTLDPNSLNIAWLGRIDDMKTNILIHSLERSAKVASILKLKINYHLIGDGSDRKKVEQVAYGLNNKFFKCVTSGPLYGGDKFSYLSKNIDLLFAMGISGLEGCALGIPTLLCDVSYAPITGDYKFRYYYETQNYILGKILYKCNFNYDKTDSLVLLIKDLYANYEKISESCYKYVTKNHDLNIILPKFMEFLNNSDLIYSRILDKKLHKYDITSRIYHGLKYGYWDGIRGHDF